MKKDFAGTMHHEGEEIHFLTLKRGNFLYELWPSPFDDADIRYTVTGDDGEEPIKSGSLLK